MGNMACEGTQQTLKYLTGLTVAILLTLVCVAARPETCKALQYSYTDDQLHHVRKRDAARAPMFGEVIRMSVRINEIFDTSLTNANHRNYKDKDEKIKSAIDEGYRSLPNYIKGSVKVIGFRSGSIIADYTINATTNNLDFTSANTQVSDILLKAGIPLAQDAFAESEETILTTKDKIYPQQSVNLSCPNSVDGVIKWTVNEKDLAENSLKYSITNDGSTLTVKDISGSDSGRYSCIIERASLPYIQWQNIDIEPRPNIIVDKTEIKFQCEDQIVPLTCCSEGYPVKWDPIPEGDEVKDSEPDCITLLHKISSTNCGTHEIFTCRLNMTELQAFDYSSKGIQVQTIRGEFDCKNESLGVGNIGDSVTGPCEKGQKGQITYQCQQIYDKMDWIPTQRKCVFETIKDLERRAEILVVEEIPAFVKTLRNIVEQNNADITQSTVTVQTIVAILVKITSMSQNIVIGKPVMQDFLKTVNIIVSNSTITSWKDLNNRNRKEYTITELLAAIENLSDRLSDDNYMINNPTFQLNRTTIKNSFIGTSLLSNSATQIEIPNVVKPTLITIIVFTNFDHVLPTHNTYSNDSRMSENRINGDVVVVKVNEPINNISITFNIMNTSLKNPQCVFWNFSLDGWDSSGCKVKPSGNEVDKVTCECNHTTSFSILMSPFDIKLPALAYITYIGIAISMASLILCLIIEMIVWKSVTRNDTSYMQHVSRVNIAVSLLIANICFIIGAAVAELEQPTSVDRCSPVVFFMHFFYLAVFFWMLISALLLLYRTVMVLSQMSRTNMMIIAFTVGYCAPLLIAVITVASTAGPKNYVSKENACWLNWYPSKALLAFVIPALTIVAFNLLVLIVVLYKMLRRGVGATTQTDEKHALMVIARCVAILTPMFGLTWGFGIGTMVSRDLGIHVVFTILNSFQGFFVLLLGTLLDSKVRETLAGKLSLKNLSSRRTRSTTAGPSSSGQGFLQRMRRRNVYNTSDPRTATSSNHFSASDT